jgi:hypothetical protein
MNDAMLIASLWLSAKAQRGRAGKSVVKFSFGGNKDGGKLKKVGVFAKSVKGSRFHWTLGHEEPPP